MYGALFSPGSFDMVTSNPPYIKETSGLKNPSRYGEYSKT